MLATTAATVTGEWSFDPDATGAPSSGALVVDSGYVRLHQTDADCNDLSAVDLSGLATPAVTVTFYGGVRQFVLDALTVDSGVWVGQVLELYGPAPDYASVVAVQVAALGVTAGADRVPPLELASVPRYTTLDAVKARLGVSGAGKDTRLTQAIVAAEVQIDRHLGAGFTGSIPVPIVEAATSIAMAIYKAGDSPTGTAGSDDWLGVIDISEEVRREFQRNPMLVGWRVEWGVA